MRSAAARPFAALLFVFVVASASDACAQSFQGGLRGTVKDSQSIIPCVTVTLVNQDNGRAIAFYEKNGFEMAGDDVNPTSGRPVFRMRWRP